MTDYHTFDPEETAIADDFAFLDEDFPPQPSEHVVPILTPGSSSPRELVSLSSSPTEEVAQVSVFSSPEESPLSVFSAPSLPSLGVGQHWLPYTIYQHLYTRSERGLLSQQAGFDSVAASSALSSEFLKTVGHRYASYLPESLSLDIKEARPKLRYALATEGYYMVGQSVYREAGGRPSFLTHQYLAPLSEHHLLTDIGFFAGSLPFRETYTETDKIEVENTKLPGLGDWLAGDLSAIIDDQTFVFLVLDVIRQLEKTDPQFIYISLPVGVEEQTEVALTLLRHIYACLPYDLRQRLGYTTFFTGAGREISGQGIHLYIVPTGQLGAQLRLGQLYLTNQIIYALDSEFYHNRSEEVYDFTTILHDDPRPLFESFERFRSDDMIQRYGYLESLEWTWRYQRLEERLNTFADYQQQVRFLSEAFKWVETCQSNQREHLFKELKDSYLKLMGQEHLLDSELLNQFLSLSQTEFGLDLLERGLNNALVVGTDADFIKLIVGAQVFPELHRKLLDYYVLKNKNYLLIYCQYRLEPAKTALDLLIGIKKIFDELGEAKTRPVIDEIIKHRLSDYRLQDCTLQLRHKAEANQLLNLYIEFVTKLLERYSLKDLTGMFYEELVPVVLERSDFENSQQLPKVKWIEMVKDVVGRLSHLRSLHSYTKLGMDIPNELHNEFISYFSGGRLASFSESDRFKLDFLGISLKTSDKDKLFEKFLERHGRSKDDYYRVAEWLLELQDGSNCFDTLVDFYMEHLLEDSGDKKELINFFKGQKRFDSETLKNLDYRLSYQLEQKGGLSFLDQQALKISKGYQEYKKNQERRENSPAYHSTDRSRRRSDNGSDNDEAGFEVRPPSSYGGESSRYNPSSPIEIAGTGSWESSSSESDRFEDKDKYIGEFLERRGRSKDDYYRAAEWLIFKFQKDPNCFEELVNFYMKRFLEDSGDKKELINFFKGQKRLGQKIFDSETLKNLDYRLSYQLEQEGGLSFLDQQALKISKGYQEYKKNQERRENSLAYDSTDRSMRRSDKGGPYSSTSNPVTHRDNLPNARSGADSPDSRTRAVKGEKGRSRGGKK